MAAPLSQAEIEARNISRLSGLLQTPAHPTFGRKRLPNYIPPPPSSQNVTPYGSDMDSSDSENEVISPSSESSSSEEECKHRHSSKHRHEKKKGRSKRKTADCEPIAKKPRISVVVQRTTDTDRDAKLIAPLQFMRYLQARQRPKACGRCDSCKKPPCGVCKACLQNIKRDIADAENQDPHTKKKNLKDRRRCEALHCERDASALNVPLPPGVPEDREELAEALAKTGSDLAEAGARSGTSEFDQQAYQDHLARMKLLREGLVILKNRKAGRRVKFPVGFHDVWGVLSSLEGHRLKFAKFVVRQSSSEESRTLEMKRRMRDCLEAAQIDIANINFELLCPADDINGFRDALNASPRLYH